MIKKLSMFIVIVLMFSSCAVYDSYEQKDGADIISEMISAKDIIQKNEQETETDAKIDTESDTKIDPKTEIDRKILPSDESIALSQAANQAEQILQSLTLEQKVGQMFFLAFRRDSSGNPFLNLTEENRRILTEYNIGGVVLFSENIKSESQTKDFISDIKSCSDVPMFIGIDEEGGNVTRTSALGYDKIPSAKDIGQTNDSQIAYSYAVEIAKYIKALGFTVNFAPVCDINTNPQNIVIGKRAFSDNPELVSVMANAFINGLSDNGIMAAAKHYPGHGDTSADSHYGLAGVSHDIERLRSVELLPFQAAADNGVSFIMVGHISAPNITNNDEPAIFSEYLCTDILRGELDFQGIAITDALDMGAITRYFDSGETAIKSINAGIDMLLMPSDFTDAYDAVIDAVHSGVIEMERIDEAVLRILKQKLS